MYINIYEYIFICKYIYIQKKIRKKIHQSFLDIEYIVSAKQKP